MSGVYKKKNWVEGGSTTDFVVSEGFDKFKLFSPSSLVLLKNNDTVKGSGRGPG